MKFKNISFLIYLLLIVCVSCDDYLDKNPDNRTDLDSEDRIKHFLVSGAPARTYSFITEISSDNHDWRPASGYSPMNNMHEEIFFWKDVAYDTGNESPLAFWTDAYGAIAVSNHALPAIQKLGNPKSLAPYKGEALLIRAFNHFNLVNVFSQHYSEKTSETDLGIPYITKPETTVDPDYKRVSVAEVYRLIEQDLLEGLPLIDDNEYIKAPKYHFNSKAAHAFATRFYLYTRKYDKVIEHANAILGKDPIEMVRDLSGFGSIPSDHNLRARYHTDISHKTNLFVANLPGSSIYVYFGNFVGGSKLYAHTDAIAIRETIKSPAPWGIYNENNKTYSCDRDVYIVTPSTSNAWSAYPKFPYYSTGNLQVIFSADEVLLSRAEAYIMKEDYENAVKDMNIWITSHTKSGSFLTRDLVNKYYSELPYYAMDERTPKKRLNPETPIVSAEQENFLHCILHMRRIETIHDGLRWFDIKRYGIEIYRNKVDFSGNLLEVVDTLTPQDPRRAIQIPATTIGRLEANPR